jgi:hypothetical protein
VTIGSAGGLGEVEVGLVCTEFYETRLSQSCDGGAGSGRSTSAATAYESWLPVEASPGVQSVRLAVSAEAPFSDEGELLWFRWEGMSFKFELGLAPDALPDCRGEHGELYWGS